MGQQRVRKSKLLIKNGAKITRGLKGNTYLWKKMEFVREIRFTKAEKINLGRMTIDL